MAAIHDFPVSAAIHDARAALASPRGRSNAEMAGHIFVLDWHGTKEDAINARDFAASQPYRDDLALWLDIALAPDCPPAEETPRDVATRHADCWPEIVLCASVLAVVMLAISGWL
jgi:hypothetical protein